MELQPRDLAYRNGRLVLPSNLADREPAALAAWFAQVPMADRVRAFRALPLNVGAAAFLVMEPAARLALIKGLNRQTTHYLVSILKDEPLLDTLLCADAQVYDATLATLAEWRRERLAHLVETRRAEVAAGITVVAPKRQGIAKLFGWLRKAG